MLASDSKLPPHSFVLLVVKGLKDVNALDSDENPKYKPTLFKVFPFVE